MDDSHSAILGEIATEAAFERASFLTDAAAQFMRFLDSNRDRIAELGGLVLIDEDPDYLSVAQNLLVRHRKRSLVIVITNFRDEDGSELAQALRLLRSRHLVMLASLRERVVGELISQPLAGADAALEVASAHLYEQARRDAFNRLAARDALMVDAEPQDLGVELVNRYHSVKRAGMI